LLKPATSTSRRALSAAALCAFASVAACAAILGVDDVKYGDADAAAAPTDAPALEAGPDAPVALTDASPSVDVVDAGPAVGCGPRGDASFCVDFEGPNPLSLQVWSQVVTYDGGSVVLADAGFSPSHAVRISGPPGDGGFDFCSYETLTRRFSTPFSSLTARAVALLDPTTSVFTLLVNDGVNSFVVLASMDGPTGFLLRLQRLFTDGGGETTTAPLGLLDVSPVGTWTEVELVVEAPVSPAAPPRLRFRVGSAEVSMALPADFVRTAPQLVAGLWCDRWGSTVVLDDIAVYLTP
jgi:hypothetical protein